MVAAKPRLFSILVCVLIFVLIALLSAISMPRHIAAAPTDPGSVPPGAIARISKGDIAGDLTQREHNLVRKGAASERYRAFFVLI